MLASNNAKLRELSLNFPKLADWLRMDWSSCLAALARTPRGRAEKDSIQDEEFGHTAAPHTPLDLRSQSAKQNCFSCTMRRMDGAPLVDVLAVSQPLFNSTPFPALRKSQSL